MTGNAPEFDQRIADWLETDPATAPPEVLSTVVAALPAIPQARRGLLAPRRFTLMNSTMRLASAAIVAVVAVGGALYLLRPGGGPGGTPSTPLPATLAPSPSGAAATVAPSPASFTSPLYGYTVDHPASWDVGPAIVQLPPAPLNVGAQAEWFDVFIAPDWAGPVVGYVGVAAQPIPDGTTADGWMRAYAEDRAASNWPCKGPADAWVDATVGTLAIRRASITCNGSMPSGEDATGLSSTDVLFVVDGTGYVMSGNPEGVDTLLSSFQPR